MQAAILRVSDDRYVTFRHHILFDYAVSRLRLDLSDRPALQHTLSKSRGLGFLLAPALGYSLGAIGRADGLVALPVDAPRLQPDISMSFRERALLKAPVAELVQVLRAAGQELARDA